MADETQASVAPAEAGQPTTQAVDVPAVETPAQVPSTPAPADSATTAPATTERLWAGKFKAPEVLEESYQHLQSEASRMAQRLAQYEKQSAPAAPSTPPPQTYNTEQLETWKEQRMMEMTQAQANGDSASAQAAAHQIRLIDAELRKTDINQYASLQTSQAAYQKLAAEVQPILTQHKDDLAPGTPIYNQAQQIYSEAVTAGAAANDFTATSAVLLALAKSGKFQQTTTLKAAVQTANSMNQAIKSAAVAGGGGANTGRSATPDIASMNAQQFEEYRHSLGVTKRQR